MDEHSKVIHVKGHGGMSAQPDFIEIKMEINSREKVYAQALESVNTKLEVLRKAVSIAGFSPEDLKTSRFSVDTNYEHEEVTEGNRTTYKNVFIGFSCQHQLKLSFDMDSKRFGVLMNELSQCSSMVELSVSVSLKNKEEFLDRVLEAVARDAHRKAEVLCKASGVALGRLLRVEYPLEKKKDISAFVGAQVLCFDSLAEGPSNYDFHHEDIKVEDSADFYWEIC